MFSTAGNAMTSMRVDSEETCKKIEKEMPQFLGRTYKFVCVEDK